jgi:hypothetical protein
MQPQASTIKSLHVVIVFTLVEYDMCSCLLFYIASAQPGSCSKDALKTFLKSSTSSRRACHQSAACGDVLFRF